MLEQINKYMSDGENWHQWGLVCFYGLFILTLTYLAPYDYRIYAWALLSLIKVGMSSYQEIWVERGGLFQALLISHDGLYDWILRTLGSVLIGAAWMIPHNLWFFWYSLILLLTYKWEWFNK